MVHRCQIPVQIKNYLQPAALNTQSNFNPLVPMKSTLFREMNQIKSLFETGRFNDARELFDKMPHRDVVAWSSMISGYTSCNLHSQAWGMFCEMTSDVNDVRPNEFTLSSVLKTCKGMKSLGSGTLVHGLVIKHGLIGSSYVSNALVDMYATCCRGMENANAVFEEVEVKSEVLWTTLIAGYTHKGDGRGALQVFRKMLQEEVEQTSFNLSIAIRASSLTGSHVYGEQIHSAVLKLGFDTSSPVMNSILDMYCKCSRMIEADRCFNGMIEKDIITWNTLIAGYEKFDPYNAVKLFSSMVLEGPTPSSFTLTSVIAAVAKIAVLVVGEQIHGGAVKTGLADDLEVANTLIDMYAKCGSIRNARKIFENMRAMNVVSWTSMIAGYGSHGFGKEAVELFDEMVKSRVRPDILVFVAVLNACSHSGLVDEGLGYFKSMRETYNIAPDPDIYGCVVDMLGRAGRVKEAYELIEAMPFTPNQTVWGAFLGACKSHKFAELGNLAASKVLESTPSGSGTYLAMSDIYASEGNWADFARMIKLMRGTGVRKEVGRSWIEMKDQIYSFVAGDKLCSDVELVYEAVDLLTLHMKKLGKCSFDESQYFMPDLEVGT